MRQRQGGEVGDLVVAHAAEEYAVELEVPEARTLRGLQPAQHIRERADTRDVAEAVGAERVETDVQAVDTRRAQRCGQRGKEDAVCRETELLDARDFPQHAAQLDDPAAHERLTASETDLPHAAGGRRGRDVPQLLERAHLAVRPLLHAFRAHAVAAAEVAEVGHGQAQVCNFPAESVLHGVSSLFF